MFLAKTQKDSTANEKTRKTVKYCKYIEASSKKCVFLFVFLIPGPRFCTKSHKKTRRPRRSLGCFASRGRLFCLFLSFLGVAAATPNHCTILRNFLFRKSHFWTSFERCDECEWVRTVPRKPEKTTSSTLILLLLCLQRSCFFVFFRRRHVFASKNIKN